MKLYIKNDKVQKYINVLRHKEYTKDYISWLQYIHVIDIDGLCKRELNKSQSKKKQQQQNGIPNYNKENKNNRKFANPKYKTSNIEKINLDKFILISIS